MAAFKQLSGEELTDALQHLALHSRALREWSEEGEDLMGPEEEDLADRKSEVLHDLAAQTDNFRQWLDEIVNRREGAALSHYVTTENFLVQCIYASEQQYRYLAEAIWEREWDKLEVPGFEEPESA